VCELRPGADPAALAEWVSGSAARAA
jgi:hypothetical protein